MHVEDKLVVATVGRAALQKSLFRIRCHKKVVEVEPNIVFGG